MIMDNRLLVARRKYDPDATRYINAVQLADGQALEPEVAQAIDAFVRGCKADNAGYAGDPTRTNWDAIKASCILCGARTIAGALVPLAGTAPTAYNFISANYNRETGLVGVVASNTYIDTNRANNADGQDDMHLAAYVTAAATGNTYLMGSSDGNSVLSIIGFAYFSRTKAGEIGSPPAIGTHAISRAGSSGFNYMNASGGVLASTKVSESITSQRNAFVFGFNSGVAAGGRTDARIAFYSVGSSLSLSALDARVSTLVSQIAAAIP